jgi:TolB protein
MTASPDSCVTPSNAGHEPTVKARVDEEEVFIIPENDAFALANTILRANESHRGAEKPAKITLQGGVYNFSVPGNTVQPNLPPIRANIAIDGNNSRINVFQVGAIDGSIALHIGIYAKLALNHITLNTATNRAITNHGTLSLQDAQLISSALEEQSPVPDGGGIANFGQLELTRVSISNVKHSSDQNFGGAVWNAGELTANCTLFAGNRAKRGGAIYNTEKGVAKVTASYFSNNQGLGGGIYNASATKLTAVDNWWDGKTPGVERESAGLDTISEMVDVQPLASSDPLQRAECRRRVPEIALGTRSPSERGREPVRPASVIVPPGGRAEGRIAFASNRDGVTSIYKMKVDATQIQRLTFPPSGYDRTPAWSPNGLRIAYTRYAIGGVPDQLRIINSDGTNDTLLVGAYYYIDSPTWSPDGQQIAFTARESGSSWKLFIINVNGTNLRTIHNTPNTNYGTTIEWSHDGQHIAFVARQSLGGPSSEPDIYTIRPDGSSLVRVTTGGQYNGFSWSYNDSRFVSQKWYASDTRANLTVLNNDGTNQQRLAPGDRNASPPHWSLNDQIIYDRIAPADGPPIYSISSIQADGSNHVVILQDSYYNGQPKWSPDACLDTTTTGVLCRIYQATPTPIPPGDLIAFTSDRDGDKDIFIASVNGGNSVPLINERGVNEFYPVWSPNKQKLAYLLTPGTNQSVDLVVFDIATGTKVPFGLDGTESQPSWASDSRRITFVTTEYQNPDIFFVDLNNPNEAFPIAANTFSSETHPTWRPGSNEVVYVSDIRGLPRLYISDATNPTNTELLPSFYPNSLMASPVWSPDGQKLAFLATSDKDSWDLWVVTFGSTTTIQPLTSVAGDEYEPSWSPDSQFLVYTGEGDYSNKGEIYYIPAAGGPPISVKSASSSITSSGNDITPTWANNEFILFVTDFNGNPEVYSWNKTTQAMTNVSNNPAADYEPSGVTNSAFDQQYDLELARYGIDLQEAGRRWSGIERQGILASVQRMARAFDALRVTIPADSGSGNRSSKSFYASFRDVLTPNDSSRITFVRSATNGSYCLANLPTITCYGQFFRPANLIQPQSVIALTEFTFIHELGHAFDVRSGLALRNYVAETQNALSAFITVLEPVPTATPTPIITGTPTIVPTATPGFVIRTITGNIFVEGVGSRWIRGERGWGSGPGSAYSLSHSLEGIPTAQFLTDYQRNTAPYANQGDANIETAADMFQNWVYRSFGLHGFANRDWRPETNCNGLTPGTYYGAGCSDIYGSGDARYAWIEDRMRNIFVANGNW